MPRLEVVLNREIYSQAAQVPSKLEDEYYYY